MELSIVLVIIGLIVGGILVGRDLIKAAEIRAVISQIEKYKTAVYTFQGKYDRNLPGDMLPSTAAKFGLWSACVWAGCGIQSDYYFSANNDGAIYMGNGSTGGFASGGGCGDDCGIFWRHLSDAHLIEGSFGADLDDTGSPSSFNGDGFPILSKYQPAGKWGGDTYVSVASLHFSETFNSLRSPAENAFHFTKQGTATQFRFFPIFTPAIASTIDTKIDDGKPTLGNFLVEAYGAYGSGYTYYTNAAASGSCVYGVTNFYDTSTFPPGQYNTNVSTGGNIVSCIPIFVIK